ncbi:MAG: Tungsten-containing aldehyde:ferredoxin oxidoreductase [Firmicutes bacterium]|nr:Tungsten-containing aldehyde:ferredoxin oxidoreductase [Bacillota bacterium]
MYPNKIRGGIAGKILYVDLSSKKIWFEDTEKYAKRFLGGRAINSFILCNEINKIYKEAGQKIKWDDPRIPLIFGVGCLVGTLMPAANRVSVDSINTFNNGKGSANCGGFWGAELKYAGYDHIVITGKSPVPVYLWINDDKVEIRDASNIWGKLTRDTEYFIHREMGDDSIQVMSIGPAGENMVRGAAIISAPGRSASGSGVGCVMGSKKLKAIAVRGHGAISVADPEKFMAVIDKITEQINASTNLEPWRKGIIEGKYLPESPAWNFLASYKNGQDDYVPLENRKKLVGMENGVPRYKKMMMSCHLCPAGCMALYEIKEGRFEGTKCPNYWINSTTYSTKLGLFDPEASIRFYYMCNQLGMDGDMCSNTLAWAFECYEKGLITKEDTGGLELNWGNEDSILSMQKKLAYREGFGDLLAEGVKEASKKLGKGSEYFAIHMKGQDTVDPYRIIKGWGFGISISPISGKHLRGAVSTPDVSGPPDVEWKPTEYKNVPEVVYWQGIVRELEDIIGNCIYVGTWSGTHALSVKNYAELLSAGLGLDLNESTLMMYGKRSFNLEKAFNAMNTDLSRKDDYPPHRYMEEPVKSGPYAGHKCDKDMWDKMLDKYYELHGWDIETGLQTRMSLNQIGLEDIAEMIARRNANIV